MHVNNYSPDDISIYDTTGKLSEDDIQKLKEILAADMNEAFSCCEDC